MAAPILSPWAIEAPGVAREGTATEVRPVSGANARRLRAEQ